MVRVEYAAVTSHDLALLHGQRGPPQELPLTPGLAATGIVVECGDQLHKWRFQGKRVAVLCPGTWSEYVLVPSDSCFLLNDSTTFELGASLLLTPLTVTMFEEQLERSRCKAIIQTGGASDVCCALLRVCNYRSLGCVSVVRNEEEASSMLRLGAKFLILESDPKFREKIAVLAEETGANVAFDCVGGTVAAAIFDALGEGGTLYCHEVTYTSAEISGIKPGSLIFQKKKIVGLDFMSWFSQKNSIQKLTTFNHIQKFDFMYRTDTIEPFPISDVYSAVQAVNSHNGRGMAVLRIDSIPESLVQGEPSDSAVELAHLMKPQEPQGG